jgi:hypothetical protein
MIAVLGLGADRIVIPSAYTAVRPLKTMLSLTNGHVVQLYDKYGAQLAAWLLRRLVPALDEYSDKVIFSRYSNGRKSNTLAAKCRQLRGLKKETFLSESYIGCYFCKLLENEAGSLVIRLAQR